MSYESLLLQELVALVAEAPTFTDAGGTESLIIGMLGDTASEELRAVDGSAINLATAPVIVHVGAEPYSFDPEEAGAPRQFGRNAAIVVRVYLRHTETQPYQQALELLDFVGNLRADIEGSARPTRPLFISCSTQVEQWPARGQAFAGFGIATVTINTGDIL